MENSAARDGSTVGRAARLGISDTWRYRDGNRRQNGAQEETMRRDDYSGAQTTPGRFAFHAMSFADVWICGDNDALVQARRQRYAIGPGVNEKQYRSGPNE